METRVSTVDTKAVSNEIDNIFGEIEKLIEEYHPSNVELNDSVDNSELDVAATRNELMGSR